MEQVIAMTYFWLKAGHIIFVIFWMAGLFMLPRFFVYHQECEEDSAEKSRWIDREKRLLRIILWPSLILVWLLGLVLAMHVGAMSQGWFHAKLSAVLVLTAYQIWMAGYAQKLANGGALLSGRSLRMLNEIPGIAAAIIVILVVVKPF